MRVELSQQVAASAERVWAVLVDIAGSASVISSIDRIELVSGPDPLDVGTRWRETRRMMGKSATEEMWVTGVDHGSSYTVAADSAGAAYESTFVVTSKGAEACTLTMSFAGRPHGTAAKVLSSTVGRLMLPATRKALAQDLADIAAAAESRS